MMTRLPLAALILALALPAWAGWEFLLTTKKKESLKVFSGVELVYLQADGYTYALEKSEAEALANALLWAAGKRTAPCTFSTSSSGWTHANGKDAAPLKVKSEPSCEEVRFIEAGRRTVEKLRGEAK